MGGIRGGGEGDGEGGGRGNGEGIGQTVCALFWTTSYDDHKKAFAERL